jgi:hypothetical protein
VSDASPSRFAGPVALSAGLFVAVVDLGRLVLWRDDPVGMLADPVYLVFNGLYFLAFPALLIALAAVHGRQAREAGAFGLVAFCVAILGTATMAGNMWFEGFAVPWLAAVLPQVFAAEKTVTLVIGALASYLLFALGWVSYGLASLRAGVFPVGISILIVLAGVAGYQAGLPPYGVPIGLAFAVLGGWMIREALRARTPDAAATRAGGRPARSRGSGRRWRGTARP